MSEKITNELIYEILKQLQSDVSSVKRLVADQGNQIIGVREDVNAIRNDINGLRGDDLRRERIQAQMDVRLERIEARLNLHDLPH
jgi:hypothetical protein